MLTQDQRVSVTHRPSVKRQRPSRRAKANPEVSPNIRLPSPRPLSRDDVGQRASAFHPGNADIIAEIRETHRRRQEFHRAEKSLTLQIKALERRLLAATTHASPTFLLSPVSSREEGHESPDDHQTSADLAPIESVEGDEGHVAHEAHQAFANVAFYATLPLAQARAGIKKHRLEVERACEKLAKQLPVWKTFAEPLNGFGPLGLAQIVGEAGDLAKYSNPAKLWKRMGLAVFNGKSQRCVAGAGAIEQGYSPVRRAIMFRIGDSLLKKQNQYRELYLARKVLEQQKVPDGTKMLWHRRAQRYAEKRLLRDLWRAWRSAQ